ncbi:MAG: cbb3-type cytochrome c oxidase subunit 3 [Pseudorhodobacter sp.]|nr:cbb3-type cytochrome c oxidase subunit 3 [Pseudorhodobacter sp.]
MDTYSLLREFADSWMLLILVGIFVAIIAWAFRPGSRQIHQDVANSIFRNEDKPAGDDAHGPNGHGTSTSFKEAWK